MTNSKSFGECLNSLLSILGISGNKLSKAINVDSSLVSRWINNKRVPTYDTMYINNISEYLSKSIKNSFQRQQIDELLFKICGISSSTDNIKVKIEKVLLESQGYSIELKSKVKKISIHKNDDKDDMDIDYLNNNLPHCEMQNNNYSNINPIYDSSISNSILELSNEDKVIIGSDSIFSMINKLLQTALEDSSNDHTTIYISFNSDIGLTTRYYKDLIRCRKNLLKAIHNGWKVVFLLGLTMNTKETAKIIEFLLPLMHTGNLNLYYFNKYDALSLNIENIIIPGVCALTCSVLNQYSKNICAFFFKNKTAVDILEKKYDLFLSTYAQPLIKYYPAKHKIDYSRYLTEIEEKIGNRFLFNYCFSILTMPKNLYKKLLVTKGLSKEEIKTALELYERRQKAFLKNLQFCYYKDIYYLDCIDDLIIHNQIYLYDYMGIDAVRLEPSDVVELLTNIINLLETYENYNISFISDNRNSFIQNINLYYIVKERQAVLLETITPSDSMRISIKEPMVVKAFEEYSKELTKKISPVNKDKNEVILWLKRQIKLLENNYNFPIDAVGEPYII